MQKYSPDPFPGQATETSGVPASTNAQTTTRHLDFTLNANKGFDYSYDAEGNQLARAGRQILEWDAANRLVAINYTGTNQRSEFTYDGLSRRVKMVEKTGAIITSERRYLWDGMAITEERDASNAVTRRFFAEGEQILTAPALNLFSERDHLGSVRALRDSTGTLRARYDYDPYGIRTKLAGDLEAATGYTGHWHHAPSGLALAPYRAYDPEMGRWLSRDPIGEAGGINLYGYVDDDPTNSVDPLGLKTCWKKFFVTNYGAYEKEYTSSIGKKLAEGDAAVADLFYKRPDQKYDQYHKIPQYAYPPGTTFVIYANSEVHKAVVVDNGRGHIKTRHGRFPKGIPGNAWIDLWFTKDHNLDDWGWASIEVEDCKKCPEGWIGD